MHFGQNSSVFAVGADRPDSLLAIEIRGINKFAVTSPSDAEATVLDVLVSSDCAGLTCIAPRRDPQVSRGLVLNRNDRSGIGYRETRIIRIQIVGNAARRAFRKRDLPNLQIGRFSLPADHCDTAFVREPGNTYETQRALRKILQFAVGDRDCGDSVV